MSRYADALHAAGMNIAAAEIKDSSFTRLECAAAELGLFGAPHAFYVPGRLEVLGKHTDYAGGRSLLCCVERGFCALAFVRDDFGIRLIDIGSGSTTELHFDSRLPAPAVHWATYPETVLRRIARNFPEAKQGVDVVFTSDLPQAAGLSSSSALVIMSFLALSAANHLPETELFQRDLRTQEDLAAYLACIENGTSFRELSGDHGVGTFGGSEDHTAILCCKPLLLSQFAFSPTRLERRVEPPAELAFVIGASGVAAEKAGSAQQSYNRLALEVSSILKTWNHASGRSDSTLGSALASSPVALDQIRDLLRGQSSRNVAAKSLLDRLEQFFAEAYVIIPSAVDALYRGEADRFGELVDRSQKFAEDVLQNQIPETMFLADSARNLGAVAASAFGAGFGGSVWALVSRAHADQFLEDWSHGYRDRFRQSSSKADFFATEAGPPSHRIL